MSGNDWRSTEERRVWVAWLKREIDRLDKSRSTSPWVEAELRERKAQLKDATLNAVRHRVAELLEVGFGAVTVTPVSTGAYGDEVDLYLWAVLGAGHPLHGWVAEGQVVLASSAGNRLLGNN